MLLPCILCLITTFILQSCEEGEINTLATEDEAIDNVISESNSNLGVPLLDASEESFDNTRSAKSVKKGQKTVHRSFNVGSAPGSFTTVNQNIDARFLKGLGGEFASADKRKNRFKSEKKTQDRPNSICFSKHYWTPSVRSTTITSSGVIFNDWPNICRTEKSLKDSRAQYATYFKKGTTGKTQAIGPISSKGGALRKNCVQGSRRCNIPLTATVTAVSSETITTGAEVNIKGTVKIPIPWIDPSVDIAWNDNKTVTYNSESFSIGVNDNFSQNANTQCLYQVRSQKNRRRTKYTGKMRFRGNVGGFFQRGNKKPEMRKSLFTYKFFYQTNDKGAGREYSKEITHDDVFDVIWWEQSDCTKLNQAQINRIKNQRR